VDLLDRVAVLAELGRVEVHRRQAAAVAQDFDREQLVLGDESRVRARLDDLGRPSERFEPYVDHLERAALDLGPELLFDAAPRRTRDAVLAGDLVRVHLLGEQLVAEADAPVGELLVRL